MSKRCSVRKSSTQAKESFFSTLFAWTDLRRLKICVISCLDGQLVDVILDESEAGEEGDEGQEEGIEGEERDREPLDEANGGTRQGWQIRN